MKALYYIACFVIMAGSAQAESYLCVGELSTGFRYESGQWKTAIFHVREDKFIVKRTNGLDYTVTKIGSQNPSHNCTRSAYEKVEFSRIICGGLGVGFMMDVKSLRYQELYGLGFIDGDSVNNTPSLTIGKCSRLD